MTGAYVAKGTLLESNVTAAEHAGVYAVKYYDPVVQAWAFGKRPS